MEQQGTRQVAIVTGSTKGIGAAIAARLESEGWGVVVSGRTRPDDGSAETTDTRRFVAGDVRDPAVQEALVRAAVDHFGRLDLLVNNAAGSGNAWGPLEGNTLEVWQDIYGMNVVAPYQLVLASLPHLRASTGAVVNISSIIGDRPFGPSIPYAASKAALDHLTRLLAVELGPGVRVNGVAPGFIDSAWTADLSVPSRAALRTAVLEQSPLRRAGAPEEIAEVVVAVATSTYLTGQIVTVDGGFRLVR